MINESFKNHFPFAYKYFSTLLDLVKKGEKEFPQAIILEGSDTILQYFFALELARNLNCENQGDSNCDCINCKWIRSHSHPSVNNVSEIHFKGEGDETKTVISVKQAKEIEKALSLSSDYHRFFIFFSSKEKEYLEGELDEFRNIGYETDINYDIKPLNYSTFHTATPNALLKSIEEPPKRTTFVFLTKSKEDILQTIVSRCLVFKLSGKSKRPSFAFVSNIFSSYPNLSYEEALNVSDNIISYIKENEISLLEFLESLIEYLNDLMKQNLGDESACLKILNDIKMVNYAIKQSKASIQDKIVLESLMLKIARGY